MFFLPFLIMITNAMTLITLPDKIIWNDGSISGFKSQVKGWMRQHDNILYYTKSEIFTFNKQYTPYKDEYIKKMFRYQDENGRLYRKRRGGKQYLDDKPGNTIGDVWNDIYSFQTITRSKEYLGYPTQKPEKLLEHIVLASSNEGDLRFSNMLLSDQRYDF